jgi:hypothetical protein
METAGRLGKPQSTALRRQRSQVRILSGAPFPTINQIFTLIRIWLCCTNPLTVGLPLSPDKTYPATFVTGMPSAV